MIAYILWELLEFLAVCGLLWVAYTRLRREAIRIQEAVDVIPRQPWENDDNEEDDGLDGGEDWDRDGPFEREELEGDEFVLDGVDHAEAFIAEAIRGLLWFSGYRRGLDDAMRRQVLEGGAGLQLGVVPAPMPVWGIPQAPAPAAEGPPAVGNRGPGN